MRLWTLELGDECLTVPLPASFFAENWSTVVDLLRAYGRKPPIRLVSDSGCVITPVREEMGPVEWWEVRAPGIQKPDLRSAFEAAHATRPV